MVGPLILSASGCVAFLAWAARGRSSSVFAPSVWRGSADRREIALTFDDGPSESTPQLLELLDNYKIKATFFQCGMHVRRLPEVARAVVAAGHEIGNHTDSHASLWLQSVLFMRQEIGRAQDSIFASTGVSPTLFRAPYGVRWPGLGQAQQEFGLLGVMWTTIGRDWALPAPQIAERLHSGAVNGAVLCLHDGRERQVKPDISATVEGVREALPRLIDCGFRFRTVTGIIR